MSETLRWPVVLIDKEVFDVVGYETMPELVEDLRTAGALTQIVDHNPDPEALLLAARRLNTNLDDCVLVGNSIQDIQAARAVGIASAAVIGDADEMPGLRDMQPDVWDYGVDSLREELILVNPVILPDEITVLHGLEAVRRRPKMYIGSTGIEGIANLVRCVLDFSFDPDDDCGGQATSACVTVFPDGGIEVRDNGVGLPVHPIDRNTRTVQRMFLHMLVGGHNPVLGLYAVNALSSSLIVTVNRDGHKWRQEFGSDIHWTQPKDLGPSESRGMTLHFWPLHEIFGEFGQDDILNVLTPLVGQYPDLRILG